MFPFVPYTSPECPGPTLDVAGHETSITNVPIPLCEFVHTMVNGDLSRRESELQLDRPTPAPPLQTPLNQQPLVSLELNDGTPVTESMLDLLNGTLEDLDNMTQTLPNTALEVSPSSLLRQSLLIFSLRRNCIASVL